MRAHLTHASKNSKTGIMPVSTTSKDTCPPSCPFRKKGCYANAGNIQSWWTQLGQRGTHWDDFCDQISKLPIGQLWRHNQAGDLPGNGNNIDTKQLAKLVKANKGRKGFTYTHKTPTPANLAAIRHANANGFTINLSANNPAHADELYDFAAAPVVTALPADMTKAPTRTPEGRRIRICPAQTHGHTCAICGLCANPKRKTIIGFPAHGSQVRAADLIARGDQ